MQLIVSLSFCSGSSSSSTSISWVISESNVSNFVFDCIRVRKLETFDSDITQEIDVDDDEEPEQKERLTMSCIKSKSPAQFYRSFTS
jgi:hypothetical protein